MNGGEGLSHKVANLNSVERDCRLNGHFLAGGVRIEANRTIFILIDADHAGGSGEAAFAHDTYCADGEAVLTLNCGKHAGGTGHILSHDLAIAIDGITLSGGDAVP